MLCWLHVCGGPTCERAASRFASDVRCASAPRTAPSSPLDSSNPYLHPPGDLDDGLSTS